MKSQIAILLSEAANRLLAVYELTGDLECSQAAEAVMAMMRRLIENEK